MFCVVQKKRNKKMDNAGSFWSYRVSIHKNYRENGEVRKKQFVIGTLKYSDLVDEKFSIKDFCGEYYLEIEDEFGISFDGLFEIVERKLKPIINEIFQEVKERNAIEFQEEFPIVIEYEDDKGKREYIPIKKGYLLDSKDTLLDGLIKGLSCYNCKFAMDGGCHSYGHKGIERAKNLEKTILKFDDLENELYYGENYDNRGICELWSWKPVRNVQHLYGTTFEKIKPRFRFDGIHQVNEYLISRSEEKFNQEREFLEQTIRKKESIQNKSEENEEFLNFISSELPDVFKKLLKEYRRRKDG